MRLTAAVLALWLSLFAVGCHPALPAKMPPPLVTTRGALATGADDKVTLRAYGPEVAISFDNSHRTAVNVSVVVENVAAEALTANGMAVATREVLSPTAARFVFRLPAGYRGETLLTTPSGEVFAFAVIGDNRDGTEVYRRLIGRLNAAKPAFVVNGGDLVPNGQAAEYDQFLQASAALAVPYYTLTGNHDIRGEGRELYNRLLAPNYYDFVWGNSHFIMLDNADGGMDAAQLAWLEDKLAKRATRHVFLFMHRPPFDPRPGGSHAMSSAELGERLVSLAARYKVTTIFASHIHAYLAGEWQGVPYHITGGAGAPLHGKREAGGFHHYLWVDVAGDKVKVKTVKIE